MHRRINYYNVITKQSRPKSRDVLLRPVVTRRSHKRCKCYNYKTARNYNDARMHYGEKLGPHVSKRWENGRVILAIIQLELIFATSRKPSRGVAFNFHSKRNSFVRIPGMKPLVALDGYAMLFLCTPRGAINPLCLVHIRIMSTAYSIKSKFESLWKAV